jgi:8-oxo-dGTP diphosphatase
MTVTGGERLLLVVAGALFDSQGRVLVQQRPVGKQMAGLWEFPGGKVEVGESPKAALARELHEELGIEVAEADLKAGPFESAALGDRHLILLLYVVARWSGDPVALDASALSWEPLDRLAELPMPPADHPLVASLRRLMARAPSSSAG